LSLGAGGLEGGATLVVLRANECVTEGGKICCCFKGSKRTVCLSENCRTKSHTTVTTNRRLTFEGGATELLIIKMGPEVGLAAPMVEPAWLGLGLDRYLREKRSVDAWVALLPGL
jgi:hypothetical protein